ncbi:MAG: hypothetical protein WC302_03325 [Candidatus Paceibacterota bacterium]|jgi:hypothetical protein
MTQRILVNRAAEMQALADRLQEPVYYYKNGDYAAQGSTLAQEYQERGLTVEATFRPAETKEEILVRFRRYTTAYLPMYSQFVKILRVYPDVDGYPLILVEARFNGGDELVEIICRPSELTRCTF